jgi:peptidoglycan-associated lipoprotein
MSVARTLHLAAALVLSLAPLGGCLTKTAKPEVSQAVVDARARSSAPAQQSCDQTPLAQVSPVSAAFAFGETALPDLTGQPLPAAARWLACHPATAVVIKPDADTHGTGAEQDAMARHRAEAVRDYLTGQGLAPSRIRILARGADEPAGEHLLVLAEGRRW